MVITTFWTFLSLMLLILLLLFFIFIAKAYLHFISFFTVVFFAGFLHTHSNLYNKYFIVGSSKSNYWPSLLFNFNIDFKLIYGVIVCHLINYLFQLLCYCSIFIVVLLLQKKCVYFYRNLFEILWYCSKCHTWRFLSVVWLYDKHNGFHPIGELGNIICFFLLLLFKLKVLLNCYNNTELII